MDHFCLICRGTDTEPLYKGLRRCRACGYIFADLQLTDDELARLYDHSLFKEGEFFDYAADHKYHAKNFRATRACLRSAAPTASFSTLCAETSAQCSA